MIDPTRHDAASGGPIGTGRGSRVDDLLVEGLDRYFLGQHEEAIHIWTRVLFLDRHHASARAYIDRARSAVSERQRRAEEALHQVAALLTQGRASEARTRLLEATRVLGEDERTAALRMKVERLERAGGDGPRIRAAVEPRRAAWWHWLAERLTVRTWLVAAVLIVAAVTLTSRAIWTSVDGRTSPVAPAQAATAAVVPVLTSADVALVRARTLYTRGRLSEALAALDVLGHVGAEQPGRVAADKLRVEIQRLLLSAAGEEGRQGPR
ncbi:MAG: hypothetical protein HQ485_14325 [Acidobacteria bacterium]|nr:hypothetical protein [Acidobacteriota bacterium]